LQRYADGVATLEEVQLLEREIVSDAEFRQIAVEYLHLDSAMEEFGVERPAGAATRRTVPFPRRMLGAAAGIAAMAVALWYCWPSKGARQSVDVEILQLTGATFAAPYAGLHVADHERLDTLELRAGEAQLRLPSDVKLSMSGPAEVRFLTPMHARVLRGKVTVDCSASGKGSF